MARLKRWGTFALVLALGAVCTVGVSRSWAGDDEATKEEQVTKPDAGTQDEQTTATSPSSDEKEAPAAGTPATDTDQ